MSDVHLPADTRIGHVRLTVSDLVRAISFYRDTLGFQVKDQEPGTARLTASQQAPEFANGVLLILEENPQARPRPPRTTGLYHIAIRLPNRPALGSLLHRLLQARYPLLGASDHKVSEALYLADPDRNGVELYTDRSRQDWPRQGQQIVMATDPLDLQSLLAAGQEAKADGEGIHPQTDIGHVHLQVSDLAKAEAFYSGLLGLDVTQRTYPGALFLSAGGYHHHVGLNTWAGRGAPPPPPGSTGLVYFSLEIPSTEERQACLERIRQADIPLQPALAPGEEERFIVQDADENRVLI